MMIKDYHDDVLKVRVIIGSGGSISVSVANSGHSENLISCLSELPACGREGRHPPKLGAGKENKFAICLFSWAYLIIRTDPANSK